MRQEFELLLYTGRKIKPTSGPYFFRCRKIHHDLSSSPPHPGILSCQLQIPYSTEDCDTISFQPMAQFSGSSVESIFLTTPSTLTYFGRVKQRLYCPFYHDTNRPRLLAIFFGSRSCSNIWLQSRCMTRVLNRQCLSLQPQWLQCRLSTNLKF